ncbi:hypothetical protein IW492_09270 [Enterococcus sp. BWB1-3]|uniref:hypothetical protein n=1 Tax=unclassified Enterococcus TaxID=2608891 RepID=UPI0019245343|nr:MULTISPECIES: hypothetical protein [unclassified Enterococcus]MBL1229420.1 hypothetical protein [Enterococcus sp. BWB1-3]MCB5956449.1 hypothetical protein [Enterococcus sp. CWB-B31]
MEYVELDFSYYKRTMEGMYRSYYLKRIILMAVPLPILSIYTFFYPDSLVVNLLLILLFGAGFFFFIKQRLAFNQLYEQFLLENQANVQIKKIEEDEFTYNILVNDSEKIRINKQGSRNLPSNNRDLTLLVGFTKTLFTKQPFQVLYYNMLELTYSTDYRLKMNKVSRVPRFLRPFMWRNIKASSTNLLRLILVNLFTVYILFRLVTYLIDILRRFF